MEYKVINLLSPKHFHSRINSRSQALEFLTKVCKERMAIEKLYLDGLEKWVSKYTPGVCGTDVYNKNLMLVYPEIKDLIDVIIHKLGVEEEKIHRSFYNRVSNLTASNSPLNALTALEKQWRTGKHQKEYVDMLIDNYTRIYEDYRKVVNNTQNVARNMHKVNKQIVELEKSNPKTLGENKKYQKKLRHLSTKKSKISKILDPLEIVLEKGYHKDSMAKLKNYLRHIEMQRLGEVIDCLNKLLACLEEKHIAQTEANVSKECHVKECSQSGDFISSDKREDLTLLKVKERIEKLDLIRMITKYEEQLSSDIYIYNCTPGVVTDSPLKTVSKSCTTQQAPMASENPQKVQQHPVSNDAEQTSNVAAKNSTKDNGEQVVNFKSTESNTDRIEGDKWDVNIVSLYPVVSNESSACNTPCNTPTDTTVLPKLPEKEETNPDVVPYTCKVLTTNESLTSKIVSYSRNTNYSRNASSLEKNISPRQRLVYQRNLDQDDCDVWEGSNSHFKSHRKAGDAPLAFSRKTTPDSFVKRNSPGKKALSYKSFDNNRNAQGISNHRKRQLSNIQQQRQLNKQKPYINSKELSPQQKSLSKVQSSTLPQNNLTSSDITDTSSLIKAVANANGVSIECVEDTAGMTEIACTQTPGAKIPEERDASSKQTYTAATTEETCAKNTVLLQ